jgi:transcriptional regulator with XRE-family HTH domain
MDVGDRLRAAREARGLSLEAVANTLRVKPSILQAIENNDAAALPPRPYGRGFVRTYAAHLGLEPHDTARDYFLQFAPAPQPEPPPPAAPRSSRWSWSPLVLRRASYVVAAVVLFGLVLLGARRLLRQEATRQPIARTHAEASGPVGTGGSSEPARPSKPTAALTVELEATDRVWVAASADGRRTLYGFLKAGDRETVRADREIAIRVGDAGALRWRINDRPAAVMGLRGAVRSVRLTPGDVQTSSRPAAPGAAPPGPRR